MSGLSDVELGRRVTDHGALAHAASKLIELCGDVEGMKREDAFETGLLMARAGLASLGVSVKDELAEFQEFLRGGEEGRATMQEVREQIEKDARTKLAAMTTTALWLRRRLGQLLGQEEHEIRNGEQELLLAAREEGTPWLVIAARAWRLRDTLARIERHVGREKFGAYLYEHALRDLMGAEALPSRRDL